VTCCIVCNICFLDYQVDIVAESDRFRITRIESDSDSEPDKIELDLSFEDWANDDRDRMASFERKVDN